MAKSIRLSDVSLEYGNTAAMLPSGSFWEHWFNTQHPGRPADQNLDEHGIWEKAINLSIITTKKASR
jgi:hypothetical protein